MRDFLLYELEQAFGKAHIEKLASFLQQYAQQCVEEGYEREAHIQSALIIQNPPLAAQHIGESLKRAINNQQTQETHRLLYVLQSLLSPVEEAYKKPLQNLEKLASLHTDIQADEKQENLQRYPKLSMQKPAKNFMQLEVPTEYLGKDGIKLTHIEKPRKRIIIKHAQQANGNFAQQGQQDIMQNTNLGATVNMPKLYFTPEDFVGKDEIELPIYTQSLDLSGILIDETIREIGQLKQITYLKLSGMELSALSFFEEVQAVNMTFDRLEVLDLSYNNLTTFLPTYLDLMPNLRELYLHGNAFVDLPEDFVRVETNCLNRLKRHYKMDYIETVNGVSFKMIFVEGGAFQMGNSDNPNALPAHEVRLSDFFLAETPVTQALWREVMNRDGDYQPLIEANFAGDNHPIVNVSWEDAQIFLTRLNERITQETGENYILPTEAQWEHAAREGKAQTSQNISGVNDALIPPTDYPLYAHYGQHEEKWYPIGVKAKEANILGLYGMSGNVWDWCADVFKPNAIAYTHNAKNNMNPLIQNKEGEEQINAKVIRGGAYNSNDKGSVFLWFRFSKDKNTRAKFISFRLCRYA